MKNKKKSNSGFSSITLLIILVVILIALVVFYFLRPVIQASKKTRISYSHDLLETMTIIAEKEHYFKNEGLDFQIVNYPTGKEALENGLLLNKVDIAASEITPIVIKYIDNAKLKILAVMSSTNNQIQILVRKSSNIADVSQLKNKLIATEQNSTAHYFITQLLEQNGFTQKETKLSFVSASSLPDLIARKRIDAIVIQEPYIHLAKTQLNNDYEVFSPKNSIYRTYVYVTTESYIKTHPKEIQQFLRAVQKAEGYIPDNQFKALSYLLEDPLLDTGSVQPLFDTTTFSLTLDDILMINLTDQAEWAVSYNLPQEKIIPDLTKLIYTESLKKVKPGTMFLDF